MVQWNLSNHPTIEHLVVNVLGLFIWHNKHLFFESFIILIWAYVWFRGKFVSAFSISSLDDSCTDMLLLESNKKFYFLLIIRTSHIRKLHVLWVKNLRNKNRSQWFTTLKNTRTPLHIFLWLLNKFSNSSHFQMHSVFFQCILSVLSFLIQPFKNVFIL